MTTKNDKGVLSSEMKVKELKELAVSLKLVTEDEVKAMKRPEVLKLVQDWEEKALGNAENVAGTPVAEAVEVATAPAPDPSDENYFNGKKVLSRTPREINGKQYVDITVESGEVFTELA